MSLKLLAEQLLIGCKGSSPRGLYISGELPRQRLAFSSRVVLYASPNNQGAEATARVLQAGPFAEVVAGPANPAVARMLGYRQIARGVVHGGTVQANGHRLGDVPAHRLTDGATVGVFAHPSALMARPAPHPDDGALSARITVSQALGPTHQLTLDLAGEIFEAPWEGEGAPPATGELVAVVPRPGTLRVFEASSERDGRSQARP